MKRNRIINALLNASMLLVLAAVFYSCGGGGGGSSYGSSSTTPPPTSPTATSTVEVVSCPASGTTAVSVQNFAFSPAGITVPVNAIVKWTNLDSTTHTVTSTTVPTNGTFDSQLNPGASVCMKFSSAGSFSYHCSIHTTMTGMVTVQ